jgi:hypothetical protein
MLNVVMLSVVAPEKQLIIKRFRITLVIEGATEIVLQCIKSMKSKLQQKLFVEHFK